MMNREISEKVMWYKIDNEDDVYSPALLVYPDRIDYNIRKMIEIAGNANRLRPHVKSHKMAEIVKMQMKHGINKFKCATISETEMVALCGAKDILLAMQPVGPNIERFLKLIRAFPDTNFSCITDSESITEQLSAKATASKQKINVWIDLNVGMNRTGIAPGKEAISLFNKIVSSSGLNFEGLHVYDGHLHEPDLEKRIKLSNEAFALAADLETELKKTFAGPVKKVAGGTPTFPVHALRKDVELSPGTLLLCDWGYSTKFKDLEFLHAAVLLTRVVSKPGKDLLCIDLGHKALASEMPHPRANFPEIKEFMVTTHSEEHMVIKTEEADKYKVGDTIYCIPWHICPTVDRHDMVSVVNNNKVTGTWKVEARKRVITF